MNDSSVNTVRIIVTTFNSQEFAANLGISDATAGATVGAPPPIRATIESVSQRPGMTGGEILICIAINLATGVPTSLLAAWIWEKISANGENPVALSGSRTEANSQEEVQALAGKLKAESQTKKD